MPRYVNAHTHLELTALGGKLPENVPFLEWITALMAMRRGFSDDTVLRGIDQGIQTLVDTGTVGVGDITASGLSVEPLLDSGLAGTVFLEVLGREREPALERLAAAQRRITSWRAREGRMRIGLSVHAPYSCHADLFRAVADWCEAEQVPLAIHIAESPAEAQYLRDGTGPFAELSERLYPHLPRAVATGLTPVGYLESLDALRVRPLLFHGVEVTEEDLLLLKQHDCAMVHCPRSNQRLLCERMPLECYLHHGITVALGTDSLASAPSLDLREEIDAAAKLHGTRVSRETLEVLATTGGARALGIEL